MSNKSIDFEKTTGRVLESWGFTGEKFVFGENTLFSFKKHPVTASSIDLVSVGCFPTVFLEYLMLNKSIGFEDSTVRVLESRGFIRGNFIFGEIT